MYNNYLVTGGAGFIGSNFVHYLVDKYPEANILVLDKLTYAGNLDNIQSLIDEEKVTFVKGDIADIKFINRLFDENSFDCVVNFAAETHVDRSIDDAAPFVDTNIVGTFNLLDACNREGVERYHQVSTDEVYGDLGLGSTDFFREDSQIDPNCPYAATKASADLMVLSYHRTHSMKSTVSRCSNNYGPYQYPEKLIPFFFSLLEKDEKVPMYGDGNYVRDWLYVTDHCVAIDSIINKGKPGEVYNIGGNNEKSNLEIFEYLCDFLDKPRDLIEHVEDRKAHDRRYAIDASKMKNELNWEPSVKFEDGIQMTFNWYKNNAEWIDNALK